MSMFEEIFLFGNFESATQNNTEAVSEKSKRKNG
jgi:hypothetical protein